MSVLKQIAGAAGKALDAGALNYLPFQLGTVAKVIGDRNVGESLQSYGGSAPGSTYQYVPQANASGGGLSTTNPLFQNITTEGGPTLTNPSSGGLNNNVSRKDELLRIQNEGGLNPAQQTELQQLEASTADPYDQLRSDINAKWDAYINSIGSIANEYLPQQRTAQENIANTQLQQGTNQIEQQRASSLRDIGSNIRNAFQAGNVFLGTRGAGDSSAANQYQFALSKEAGKQTGQLNEFVNGQLNSLQSQHDIAMQQISQWFADAQTQVKQQIANGELNKATDIQNLSQAILDQAIQWKNQLQQNSQSRYNALLEWAANNSSNVNQLQQNIASIPQAIGSPMVDATGNFTAAPTGYGTGGTTDSLNFTTPFSWIK